MYTLCILQGGVCIHTPLVIATHCLPQGGLDLSAGAVVEKVLQLYLVQLLVGDDVTLDARMMEKGDDVRVRWELRHRCPPCKIRHTHTPCVSYREGVSTHTQPSL